MLGNSSSNSPVQTSHSPPDANRKESDSMSSLQTVELGLNLLGREHYPPSERRDAVVLNCVSTKEAESIGAKGRENSTRERVAWWIGQVLAIGNALGAASAIFFGIMVVISTIPIFQIGIIYFAASIFLLFQALVSLNQNYRNYVNDIVRLVNSYMKYFSYRLGRFFNRGDSENKNNLDRIKASTHVRIQSIPEDISTWQKLKNNSVKLLIYLGAIIKSVIGAVGITAVLAAVTTVTGFTFPFPFIVSCMVLIFICACIANLGLQGEKIRAGQVKGSTIKLATAAMWEKFKSTRRYLYSVNDAIASNVSAFEKNIARYANPMTSGDEKDAKSNEQGVIYPYKLASKLKRSLLSYRQRSKRLADKCQRIVNILEGRDNGSSTTPHGTPEKTQTNGTNAQRMAHSEDTDNSYSGLHESPEPQKPLVEKNQKGKDKLDPKKTFFGESLEFANQMYNNDVSLNKGQKVWISILVWANAIGSGVGMFLSGYVAMATFLPGGPLLSVLYLGIAFLCSLIISNQSYQTYKHSIKDLVKNHDVGAFFGYFKSLFVKNKKNVDTKKVYGKGKNVPLDYCADSDSDSDSDSNSSSSKDTSESTIVDNLPKADTNSNNVGNKFAKIGSMDSINCDDCADDDQKSEQYSAKHIKYDLDGSAKSKNLFVSFMVYDGALFKSIKSALAMWGVPWAVVGVVAAATSFNIVTFIPSAILISLAVLSAVFIFVACIYATLGMAGHKVKRSMHVDLHSKIALEAAEQKAVQYEKYLDRIIQELEANQELIKNIDVYPEYDPVDKKKTDNLIEELLSKKPRTIEEKNRITKTLFLVLYRKQRDRWGGSKYKMKDDKGEVVGEKVFRSQINPIIDQAIEKTESITTHFRQAFNFDPKDLPEAKALEIKTKSGVIKKRYTIYTPSNESQRIALNKKKIIDKFDNCDKRYAFTKIASPAA